MKQQLEDKQSRIDLQRGMAHQFLEHRRNVQKKKAKQAKEAKKGNTQNSANNSDDETKEDNYTTQSSLNVFNDNIGDAAMESILQTVIDLINLRAPLSDDLLLLCWKYEMTSNKQHSFNFDPLNTRLWRTIEGVLTQILEVPVNKTDFIWFKSYLFDSAVKFNFSSQLILSRFVLHFKCLCFFCPCLFV